MSSICQKCVGKPPLVLLQSDAVAPSDCHTLVRHVFLLTFYIFNSFQNGPVSQMDNLISN